MTLRRRLAYVAASGISGAGMMLGHRWARAADAAGGSGDAAEWLGIGSWVVAGVVAALIDRSAPPKAIGLASLALPLVWFGMTLLSDENSLWPIALLLLMAFGLAAGLSAAAAQRLLRRRRRIRIRRS